MDRIGGAATRLRRRLATLTFIAAVMSSTAQSARADSGFAKARERNGAYCRSLGEGAACVAKQNSEMGYFVTMMAGLTRSRAESEFCMRKGKRGRFIDWTVATPCLRQRVKGRSIEG